MWSLLIAVSSCFQVSDDGVGAGMDAQPVADAAEPDDCNRDSDPAIQVPYTLIAERLTSASWRCDDCHRPGKNGTNHSGFDISSYETLMRGGARSGSTIVVPGRPCDSILYKKLLPKPPFGDRMPEGSRALSAADLATVHDWIAEGALEN